MPPMTSRTLAIAALAALLLPAPALGEGALGPDLLRPVHPPIIIDSDADLASPASGVRGGAGTADDPYVIEGWTFLVAGSQNFLFGVTARELAPVTIVGTQAHIVLRDNVFVATLQEGAPSEEQPPARVAVTSSPGIVLRDARNVRIEENAFLGVGGVWGGVHAATSEVSVARNLFDGGNRPAIRTSDSLAIVESNSIDASSHDCCIATGVVWVQRPLDGSRVSGNTITARTGAAFGSGSVAIAVTDGVAGGGLVVVEDNVVDTPYSGIVVGERFQWLAGSARVVGNDVRAGWFCATMLPTSGLLAGNSFEGCSLGLDLGRGVEIGAANRVNGGAMVRLPADLAATTVDLAGTPLGWLEVPGVLRDVTLRGVDARWLPVRVAIQGSNVTLEDSRFAFVGGGSLQLFSDNRTASTLWGAFTLRNVSVSAAAIDSWRYGARAIYHHGGGPVTLEDVRTSGGAIGFHSEGSLATTTIRGGLFEGARNAGVSINGTRPNVVVERSIFDGDGWGLAVGAAQGSVVVRDSSFVGPSMLGATSTSGIVVDARGNWWGDASGPLAPDNALGAGQRVGPNVLYAPWLASGPGPASGGVAG